MSTALSNDVGCQSGAEFTFPSTSISGFDGFLFTEPRWKNRFVNGEDDHKRKGSGDKCGHNIPDRIRQMECRTQRIPDAGKQVHNEKYAQCAGKMQEKLQKKLVQKKLQR